MGKNLVIVESPAKAKTIEKFLGKDFTVKSSMGHVRDLPEKKIGIDVKHDFEPQYEILASKKKAVSELKSDVKKVDTVWLATDEDREGEAISWHLKEALEIPDEKTKRIAFHEITKNAILHAVENPREINIDLVNAQQARRVLDRLVGFELSPVLWKKVKPALSAGRVQSVAVRLIAEREKEIKSFEAAASYRVYAYFKADRDNSLFRAELDTRFKTMEEAEAFLQKCIDAIFTVSSIEKQPTKRTPSPPFTTSTLQQEASRKLGFPVAKTMSAAQQLYEAGFITYMRTDSVNLAESATKAAQKEIKALYGEKYSKTRKYTTKAKGAQEAHEAIRPTYMDRHSLNIGDSSQERLYDLIWKRTIASQMSDANLEKTTVKIANSNAKEFFVTVGEVLLFDGFLKVYLEGKDDVEDDEDTKTLPPLTEKAELTADNIQAIEKYTQQPFRYTEASLVRKLEELGIGRPSTYAPIISTIQKREYVVKGNKEGVERDYNILTLKKGKISQTTKKEKVGYEKGKLFPTDIGNVVNTFLVDNFEQIMNYNFTAKIEKEFDEIAQGKIEWKKMISDFYTPFHENVETTLAHSEKAKGERFLGVDPASQKDVFVKLARFGPVVQIGKSNSDDELKFAGLLPNQSIETITFEEAMELFRFPRKVGESNGEELVVNVGRFGPYVRYAGKFYSLPKTENLLTISLERCLEVIEEKKEKDAKKAARVLGSYQDSDVTVAVGRFGPYVAHNKHFYGLPDKKADVNELTLDQAIDIILKAEEKNTIKSFPEDKELRILRGKYGPYISKGNKNYRIPKGKSPDEFSYKDCLAIIEESNKEKSPKKKKK